MTDIKITAGDKKRRTKPGPPDPRPNRNLYKIVPVRLPVDKWRDFTREADALGIGSSTLARIWILDNLRKLNGNNHDGESPSEER